MMARKSLKSNNLGAVRSTITLIFLLTTECIAIQKSVKPSKASNQSTNELNQAINPPCRKTKIKGVKITKRSNSNGSAY